MLITSQICANVRSMVANVERIPGAVAVTRSTVCLLCVCCAHLLPCAVADLYGPSAVLLPRACPVLAAARTTQEDVVLQTRLRYCSKDIHLLPRMPWLLRLVRGNTGARISGEERLLRQSVGPRGRRESISLR